VVGITVDPSAANAAITAGRGIPFPILSDPDGEGAIKPFDVWSESETHARPATIVLAPEGQEVLRYVGSDALDRPDPEEALGAVRALRLEALPPELGIHEHLEPVPSARAFPYDLFAYFRGVRSASMTLHSRSGDRHSATVFEMVERMLEDLDDPAAGR
jgi:AhpC/TSA family